MRGKGETRLVAVVIGVSLALTALTVWAVAQQGQALQQRELADLTRGAATAAAEWQGGLRADLRRAFDAAARLNEIDDRDEWDAWAAAQRHWLLAGEGNADHGWTVFPRTPLEDPLPEADAAEREQSVAFGSETRDALVYLRQLATSPDPLTRAGALAATANRERQLGHPLAAARILDEVADVLRSTPRLVRFALRAELRRIDALLAADRREPARDALAEFLREVTQAHPGRLGPAEIDRLRGLLGALGVAADDPLVEMAQRLERRATRRASVLAAFRASLNTIADQPGGTPDEPHFSVLAGTAENPVVVATASIGEDTRAALVSPVAMLLERCRMPPDADVPWQIVLPGQAAGATPLAELGPAFGRALLIPDAETADRLRTRSRQRLAVVVATAVGSIGAWGLVIWMMIRAMARQRELAHLQSRFVADVSHELKTPLALIRLLSETLAEQRVRDPQRVQSYHETITRESERLTTLLDNILDMGRIESGRKRYEFGECDVAAVARQAWALFEPRFAEEGFDRQLELAADLPPVRADAAALQQVLVNLLQNAYRYGRNGRYVRLAVRRDGHLVVITVEDHGIGMSRAQLNRLGESFFRADDARVRQTRGTGLGLAIVHHIVTAHGGKMEVHSRPGEGSTFTIWIPSHQTEVNEADSAR